MADDVFVMLTWMANYSKFYSILVVLMCFMVTVVFILRLNSDQMFWPLPSATIPLVPRREMIKVWNPYVLTINNLENTELQSGVEIRLSCQYPCLVTCLWSVGIDQIHAALQKPSHEVMIDLNSREFLQTSAYHIDNIDISEPCSYRTFAMKYPTDVPELTLGKIPRQRYPLAVSLCLPLGLQDVDITDTDVVISVYIFHLKDKDCLMKSQLIGHYIKLYNGNLLNLQPLFLSSSDSLSGVPGRQNVNAYTQSEHVEAATETDRDTSVTADEPALHDFSDWSCIVCQSAPVTTVLLPCRHTCICSSCFLQIDKCPMCRSVIDSYFRIREMPEGNLSEQTENVGDPIGRMSRWERWNHRLNQYLGFIEQ